MCRCDHLRAIRLTDAFEDVFGTGVAQRVVGEIGKESGHGTSRSTGQDKFRHISANLRNSGDDRDGNSTRMQMRHQSLEPLGHQLRVFLETRRRPARFGKKDRLSSFLERALAFRIQSPATSKNAAVDFGVRVDLLQHRRVIRIAAMGRGLICTAHPQHRQTSRFGKGQRALFMCRKPVIETGEHRASMGIPPDNDMGGPCAFLRCTDMARTFGGETVHTDLVLRAARQGTFVDCDALGRELPDEPAVLHDQHCTFTEHKDIKAIAFVGESRTRSLIMKQGADMERAVDAADFMIHSLNGVRCTSSSRMLVQESTDKEFTNKLADAASRIKVGHPLDPETVVRPLIHPEHETKVLSYFDKAKASGATIAAGGEKVGEEALKLANDVEYGLAAYLWTNDLNRAMYMTDNIDAGMMWVNSENVRAFPRQYHKVPKLGG